MGFFRRNGAERAERPDDPLGLAEPPAEDELEPVGDVAAAQEEAALIATERLPKRIRPKLWARAEIAEHEAVLQLRPLADDLAAVLCIDLPTTVQNVRPEDVEAVGLPVEELWRRALTQLDDGEPVERVPLDEARRVEIIASDSQFLATRVLDLEKLIGPIGKHGALLALPHRHMVMVHTIEDGPTLLEAVDILVPVAARAHADGPGALSPHLYWWHGGELERIPVDGEATSITPPPGFVELLSALSA